MIITNAQYHIDPETNENGAIKATIDGVVTYVPLSQSNRHYIEIMRQVDAGTLTIADAD
tara:strand:- start:294 stop:470 length:177 start_codon:yes stop_codon:yes gene_type:complete